MIMYPKIQVITDNTIANTHRCEEKSVITSSNKLKVIAPAYKFASREPDFLNDLTDDPKIIKKSGATIKNHAFLESMPTKRNPSNNTYNEVMNKAEKKFLRIKFTNQY
jgi:hypothetical protein